MVFLRPSRLIRRLVVSLILALAVLWAAAAIWIDSPEPRALAGALAGALILIAVTAALLIRPRRRATLAVFVPFVLVLAWWLMLEPGNGRDWQPDVARLPSATIDGSRLRVRNVRNFDYRDETDCTERRETRTYDLDTLVGFDMFVSFWGPTLYGHTIASWAGVRRCSSSRDLHRDAQGDRRGVFGHAGLLPAVRALLRGRRRA